MINGCVNSIMHDLVIASDVECTWQKGDKNTMFL